MRRSLIVLAVLLVTTLAGPAAASASTCATAAAATYRHTFSGPAGTATVAAPVPLCSGQSQAFSLVSYTVAGSAQFVYDVDHAVVDANHRSVTLDVAVPRCATQVDAVFGSAVPTETAGFGTVRLGSASGTGHRSSGDPGWYTGGTASCAPQPSVIFASDCDGGFTATLANRAGAAVTAVFLIDDHMYRVAAGTRTTIVGDGGGSLTVRDNTFKTNTGTWSMPVSCTQPATTPTTALPLPTPAATTPVSAVPAVSSAVPTVTSARATTVTPGTIAAAGGTTFEASAPAAVESAVSAADLAVTGSSSGSVALIALGVLLIGGGLVILGRQIYRARHAG